MFSYDHSQNNEDERNNTFTIGNMIRQQSRRKSATIIWAYSSTSGQMWCFWG